MLSVVMLSVIVLSVVMLRVFIIIVGMLNVVAPFFCTQTLFVPSLENTRIKKNVNLDWNSQRDSYKQKASSFAPR